MKELSAGGVITKKINNSIYVLLVEHKDNTFVFPKGHVKSGETPEKAARREILEETGLSDISLREKLGVISRTSKKEDGTIVEKDIVMFRIIVNNYNHVADTDEIYGWFGINEVEDKLRYAEDRDFFNTIKLHLT